MKEFHDIEKSLLDKDGSCRDLNFESPTWDGVDDLLGSLMSSFGEVTGADQDGEAITVPLQRSLLERVKNRGHIRLFFCGGNGLLKNLQVFVCPEDNGSPFIELTFFPEDINPTNFLRRDFIEWAFKVQGILHARRCYARFENVSWLFGDTGKSSGVFFISDETRKGIT